MRGPLESQAQPEAGHLLSADPGTGTSTLSHCAVGDASRHGVTSSVLRLGYALQTNMVTHRTQRYLGFCQGGAPTEPLVTPFVPVRSTGEA